jgi:ATP-binding cassette subfamily B protein
MSKTKLFVEFLHGCLHPYRKLFAVVLIIIFIETLFYSFLGFSFKLIIDALNHHQKSFLIVILNILFFGCIAVIGVGVGRDFLYLKILTGVTKDLRLKLFQYLSQLPMSYYSKTKLGTILLYFSTDINTIGGAVSLLPSGIISPIMSLIINIIFLSIIDWKLTFITLFFTPLLFIAPYLLSHPLEKEIYERMRKEGETLSVTQENVSMQIVIRAFGLFDHFKRFFVANNASLGQAIFKVNFLNNLMSRSAQNIPVFLQIVVLIITVYMVYAKIITVAALVAFYALFNTLIYNLTGLNYSLSTINQSVVSMRRLREFLDVAPEQHIMQAVDQPTTFTEAIKFEDVTFSYNSTDIIVKDINFTIPHNKFVAFVGPSGSGKSTVLNLLLRFYDPTSGIITLDGKNLRDIPADALNQVIGLISQEPLLFNMSVRENIRLGKLDATQAEIEAAAKSAEIHDVIAAKAEGYDTILGERGVGFSIGQRQRIAIARAIIRHPGILLLDEPTSALDPATEYAINSTLERICKECTSVAVTHRLDLVINADCIFVMRDKQIIERGSHKELLEKKGFYKELWDKQHGFIFNDNTNNVAVTADRLQAIPLFKNFSDELLNEITPLFKTANYAENQIIISEGDKGDQFYILAHGKVAVLKNQMADLAVDRVTTEAIKDQTPDLTTNRITTLADGDYFGEIALFKNIPRTASVLAITPCICLTLSQSDFLNLLKEYPELKDKVEKEILARTGNSSQ